MVGKIKQLTFSDGTAVTPPSLGTIVTDASAVTYLDFTEGSAPAAPSAGAVRVYSKAGDVLAYKTPGGTEVQVLTSTGISTAVPEVDASDATKQLVTSLSAAVTGKKTTLSFAQTVDRVVSFPDATDTLVGRATADILSNKTFSDALTLTEIATPTSPSAGSVKMYAKSGDAVYILNSAGTETQVGSGSGQKNYAQVSSNTAAGWTGFGTVAVTTDVTSADLPRPNTTQTGWKLTPSGVSGTFTVTIATPAVFTATAHGMRTGFIATLSNSGGALPTGLTAGTPYFVTVVDANTFKVSTTYANLLSGTFVATSGSQSGTQSFAFGGGRIRFTLDPADYNVKQQLQHAQNILSGATGDWSVDVWSNTASNYSGTYTRLPLSTDSNGTSLLPNLEGTYRTTFDAPGSAAQYIEVTYQRASANTHALVGSDLIAGPGTTVQGAAVSDWQNYTPTFSAGMGTVSAATYYWRRVGSQMEIVGVHTLGTVASSVWSITIPSGYTISSSVAGVGGGSLRLVGQKTNSSGNYDSYLLFDGSTNNTLFASQSDVAPGKANGNTWTTSSVENVRAFVPITEWAGSGVVNLANNGTVNASAKCDTGNGFGSTNTKIRRFTNSATVGTAITYADSATLGGTFTVNETGIYSITYDDKTTAAATHGVSVNSANLTTAVFSLSASERLCMVDTVAAGWGSTSVTARLNAGDVIRAHTDGTQTNNTNGVQFSITKIANDAGQAVGFGTVTGTSSGLVPASNTSLDNASATRLGLMQYLHGGSYSGGLAPTVTLSAGGGSLSTVVRAVFVPYQMNDGTWRLKFNLYVTLSSVARTDMQLAVNGVTAKNVAGYLQYVTGSDLNAITACQAFWNANSSNVEVQHASSTTTAYSISGDIELDSKPTWAY